MKDWLRSLVGRGRTTPDASPDVRPSGPGPAGPSRGPTTRIHGASFTGPSAGPVVLCPAGPGRPVETGIVSGAPEAEPSGPGDRESSFLVLDGPAAGELLVAWDGPLNGTLLLLDRAPSRGPGPSPKAAPRRIGPTELTGGGFPGVTGVRALYRTAASAGLRLGPPPGALWIVEGLRGVAVFQGKLELDGGDGKVELRAGSVAAVADPRGSVRILAGNDSARAVAFCDPAVRIRLA